MKKGLMVVLALALLVLSACGGQTKTVELQPFIGGNQGVVVGFEGLRKEVFDSGEDPFDVTVKLENRGETLVAKNDVRVKLSGIRPQEFNKVEGDLIKNSQDDLVQVRKQDNTVFPGTPVFVDFTGLNHVTPITGSSLAFPLRAEVCYLYKTMAVSKVCVRENLLNPKEGGICEINEAKPLFNSGAPVKIENFKETAVGSDKIRFTFDVRHVGSGSVYEKGGRCEIERQKNKVGVKVDTGLSGLTCTGLSESEGNAVKGVVTLFEGVKTIGCTQQISSLGDYEAPVKLEVEYDYNDAVTTEITVKHTGE